MPVFNPKIFEVDNGRCLITDNAHFIPEIKALIDKYPDTAEAYLIYCHYMTSLDSPYCNLPEEEKSETIIFDINQTIGAFDPFEPLLQPAVDKLESLYETDLMRYFKSLKISIKKMGDYLKNEEISSGRDGNLGEIIRIHKESGSTLKSFKDIEKQVEEEINLRGAQEMGDY
jgi:hypothetical protein